MRAGRKGPSRIFRTHWGKGYSFTDCTSFALIDRHVIRNVFAYDWHFRHYAFAMHP